MNRDNLLESLKSRLNIVATVEGDNVIELARQAGVLGADLIELRIDRMARAKEEGYVSGIARKLKEELSLPLIATVRSTQEQESRGLFQQLSDDERLRMYEEAIPHADFVDTEISSSTINGVVIQRARMENRIVILSYHNFANTPSQGELLSQAETALSLGADVVKIAVMANTLEDVKGLLNFTQSWDRSPLVALSLGEKGSLTRLAGFLFGSCLTYGYVFKPVGPGQLSVKLLYESRRLYFRT